jgi:hypothetical protein
VVASIGSSTARVDVLVTARSCSIVVAIDCRCDRFVQRFSMGPRIARLRRIDRQTVPSRRRPRIAADGVLADVIETSATYRCRGVLAGCFDPTTPPSSSASAGARFDRR